MKWTENQQEAISLREKNILVSAAAGSGKTAVLVERIKGLLLSDGIELSNMLIVTFSNAAASEMKEKIVAALNEELYLCGSDAKKQRFLRRQLDRIHRCNISTFHAFAMEVIRRYFHLIDAEPNFRICDEGQKTILQSEAMEELFAERFSEGCPAFLAFLKQYGTSKNENDVKDMILKTYEFIQSLPDPFSWLEEKTAELVCTTEEFAAGPAFSQICRAIDFGLELTSFYLKEAELLLQESGVESLAQKIQMDIRMVDEGRQLFAEALQQTDKRQEAFDKVGACLRGETGGFQRLVAAKADKEAYEEVKEEVTALRDKGRAIFKKLGEQYAVKSLAEYVEEIDETAGPAKELLGLVRDFHQMYRSKKEKKCLLDFSDIEHYALEILAHEEAAKEYRQRFSYIFVDEYQDSNLVQETLISRICRENNVFMVGDVKQSIYKFRLAEPELFIEKYQRYKKSATGLDTKVDLNRNFRSKGNIISAINGVFSQVMSSESTGMEYDEDAALYKGVDYKGELDYPVSLHLLDDGAVDDEPIDEEIRNMKKAELEACAAARIIKEAKGKPIFDGKKNCLRPLQSKDIVILLRGAKGYADLYYKALNDEGISAFMDNSDGYFDTVEIQIFLNLLQLIDNESQDLPLLSVLRSPIFDFTVDELAEIRLGQPAGAYYEAFYSYLEKGEDETLRQRCTDAAKSLKRWRRKAAYTPLSDLLSMLADETGYSDFIAAIPGGLQRQANLRALVDKAVEYEASQSKGLFGFIRYIEALKKEKISVGQARLVGENDDAVRIMTVHKSKGLEFPFVLVGGLGRRFNLRQDTAKVSFHKELGVAMRLVEPSQSYYKKTLLQTLIEQKKLREDMAEEIRTLYVAFTRAMDELVLLGTVTDVDKAMKKYQLQSRRDVLSASCYLDMIVPIMTVLEQGPEGGVKLYRHGRGEYSAVRQRDAEERKDLKRLLTLGFDVPENEETRALAAEINRRLSYVYPAALEEKKSKYSVSELAASEGRSRKEDGFSLEGAVPGFIKPARTMTAAERGTAIHRVMELIPFTAENGQTVQVKAFIEEVVKKELMSKEDGEAVEPEKVSAFFRSEIGRRACAASVLHREESFNMKKDLEGQQIIVQGTIDCYFKENDHYVLLDYKSNHIRQGTDGRAAEKPEAVEELVAYYRPQLELYKEALEKIRGVEVEEVYLYLFSVGKEIRVL